MKKRKRTQENQEMCQHDKPEAAPEGQENRTKKPTSISDLVTELSRKLEALTITTLIVVFEDFSLDGPNKTEIDGQENVEILPVDEMDIAPSDDECPAVFPESDAFIAAQETLPRIRMRVSF